MEVKTPEKEMELLDYLMCLLFGEDYKKPNNTVRSPLVPYICFFDKNENQLKKRKRKHKPLDEFAQGKRKAAKMES